MELDVFFVRDKVIKGSLCISHVPSLDQTIDALTQPLSHPRFCALRDNLQVFDAHYPQLTGGNRVYRTLPHQQTDVV